MIQFNQFLGNLGNVLVNIGEEDQLVPPYS